jgi:hypothetical protein
MLFAPFVKKKKDDAFSISADNMSSEIRKYGVHDCLHPKIHFESIFNPKLLGNILRVLLNQSMASKSVKSCPKTRNQSKIKKISMSSYMFFLVIFKVRKT